MMLKMKSFGLFAGCALAAGSLCAESCNFESDTVGNTPTSWSDGAVTNNGSYASGIAGFPLPEAAHTKVLLVEGDSTYTVSEASGALVDMMVQVALPDDALETPESGAHIAVAVDTNGIFNVYCKNKSGAADWYPLSSKVYADGAWARVSLLFDYSKSLCQVRIDGEPMMTANGYLNTTRTDNGAWYNLATDTSPTAVSNLKVVGCTAIDDVVIAADATDYAIASSAKANGVSCAWLDQYGLGWDTTASYDSSKKADGTTAMTVADKYKYCFSPFDGQGEADFAIKSMGMTDSSVTVGVPEIVATAGRKVVLESATNANFSEGKQETPVNANTTTVVINRVPEPGKVLYFHLRATDDNVNN